MTTAIGLGLLSNLQFCSCNLVFR